MKREIIPADRYSEYLHLGQEALTEKRNSEAMVHLGNAMLARQVYVPSERRRTIRMGKHLGNRRAKVIQVAEYAMPRGLAGIHAQRVTVQFLDVGHKTQSAKQIETEGGEFPGLDINILYPFNGTVRAKVMWEEIKKGSIYCTISDETSYTEANGFNLDNARSIASIMNWALTSGECLAPEMHGVRTYRDYMQTVNLGAYALFTFLFDLANGEDD